MRELAEVGRDLGFSPADLIGWGEGQAKLRLDALARPSRGQLILVTAMTPTPAGEGKTTVAIGLADGLRRLGQRSAVALREPSMGPVFGSKGGGCGGGRAQVVPADSINLHFTGDLHAVASAHNLLAAAVDNHLHFGNSLGLDVRRLIWPRVLDVNDRSLREVVIGLGGPTAGIPRQDRFDITAASEVTAVLSLAHDYDDLKARLSRMVVGLDREGAPVTAGHLRAAGSLAVLLRQALLPNLVQTLEGTPALVHGGAFANIAHGTSSLLAARAGLGGADFLVQEAGFGADLGAEKFLHLFCPKLGQFPSLAVLVITGRALRRYGAENALWHANLLRRFGLPVLIALNRMEGESTAQYEELLGHPVLPVDAYSRGGEGTRELAEAVLARALAPAVVKPLYEPLAALPEKIAAVAREAYGSPQVHYSGRAEVQLRECRELGFGDALPCLAKSPFQLHEAPLSIRAVHLLAGAGFVVPICGEVQTMPGLGKSPNLERIDLDSAGTIRWT